MQVWTSCVKLFDRSMLNVQHAFYRMPTDCIVHTYIHMHMYELNDYIIDNYVDLGFDYKIERK